MVNPKGLTLTQSVDGGSGEMSTECFLLGNGVGGVMPRFLDR